MQFLTLSDCSLLLVIFFTLTCLISQISYKSHSDSFSFILFQCPPPHAHTHSRYYCPRPHIHTSPPRPSVSYLTLIAPLRNLGETILSDFCQRQVMKAVIGNDPLLIVRTTGAEGTWKIGGNKLTSLRWRHVEQTSVEVLTIPGSIMRNCVLQFKDSQLFNIKSVKWSEGGKETANNWCFQ